MAIGDDGDKAGCARIEGSVDKETCKIFESLRVTGAPGT